MPLRKNDHETNRLKNARLKKRALFPKSKKLKRPSDSEQAREWLRQVADHLSNFPNAGPAYRFVACAIKRFLRGKPGNLSKELGLVSSPGRPRTFPERIAEKDRARKTHKLIRDGKTRAEIEEMLDIDQRTLWRTYEKFLPQFEEEERLAHLDRAVREVLRERPKPR